MIIGLIAWQFIPFHALLYQMGRRQIPDVLYASARCWSTAAASGRSSAA
ncbi:MAG TPA: hypothetical protein VGH88_08300 [Streptosporangiaceae bacterium]